jgi:hypothetical protein
MKKEENLLQNSILKEGKNHYKQNQRTKYWTIYRGTREISHLREKFDPLEEANQEFRRKPQLINHLSNNMEIPKVDRNRFEYITKNFSKNLNYHINRWLEFRETLFTIQNFDVMRFAKTIETITIDDRSQINYKCNYYDNYVSYCIMTVDKTKEILGYIKDGSISNWILKEVIVTLYITNELSLLIRRRAMETLYENLLDLKKKVIRFKGKPWKTYKEGDYYKPAVQEILTRNSNKPADLKRIQEQVKHYTELVLKVDGNKFDFKKELDDDCEHIIAQKKNYDKYFEREVQERPESKKLSYEFGDRKEIENAKSWKRNTEAIREQIKKQNVKRSMVLRYNDELERKERETLIEASMEEDLEVVCDMEKVIEDKDTILGKWGNKPQEIEMEAN